MLRITNWVLLEYDTGTKDVLFLVFQNDYFQAVINWNHLQKSGICQHNNHQLS